MEKMQVVGVPHTVFLRQHFMNWAIVLFSIVSMEEMLIKIYKEISSTTTRIRENNKELGNSKE